MGAGSAEFPLLEPDSVDELFLVVSFLAGKREKIFPLGAGTNMVGADKPFPMTVIRLSKDAFTRIEGDGPHFRIGCGIFLSGMFSEIARRGFGSASGLSGIPGTLGGAIRMNAGANGLEIGKFVCRAEGVCLTDGKAWKKDFSPSDWRYRESPVPENVLLTFAELEFSPVDQAVELEKIRNERVRRAHVTPHGRSAGSVFRNPDSGLPAGLLLDLAGCRAMVSGNARVSPEHANWIVAGPEGCAESDVLELVSRMAGRVRERFGIVLKNELKFANKESNHQIGKVLSGMKILVLKGGTSSEREVSLISGGAVAEALRKGGHDVREYDMTELKVTSEMRDWADVVYPVLHGGFGEDGRVQEMFEKAEIRFVGSGSKSCRDIMDKIVSKKIMDENGIRNARSVIVDDINAPLPENLSLPLIVKPPCEGSTFGLSLVSDASEWKKALELSFRHGHPALVEEFIEGIEGTVGILDGEALPMIEIRYPGKIYDYDAKYTHAHGETKYICPPTGISESAQKEARELSLKFYNAISARDMLRVDVIVSKKDNRVFVLEGNALPGCTPSSLLPKAAGVAGITFIEMCSRLASAAAKR